MALYAVLFAFTTTGALPLGPSEGNVTFDRELTIRADACTPASRTVFGVLWGCLTTIFACTWLAIHPNVPGPEDSRWKILSRRAMIMALAIVFPEYTTVWAIRQWQEAKRISRKMHWREDHFPEWTITHSFFLTMGGFILVDEAGKPCGPLLLDELLRFKTFENFKFPSISEREIQDRSKGDALSKALIFLHTSWFLLQVLARPISGLPVTELELVTVAIASLNILAYGFWFRKPLNVECPIQVFLPYRIPHFERDSSPTQQPPYTESRESMALNITDALEPPSSPSVWTVFARAESEIPLPQVTNPNPRVQNIATFAPPPDSQERLPGPPGLGPPGLDSTRVNLSNVLEIPSMDIADALEVESHPCTPSGSTNSMRLNSQISLPSVPNPLSRVQRITAFTRDLTWRTNPSMRRQLQFLLSSFTTSLIRWVQHVVAFTRNLAKRVITMIKTHLRLSLLPMVIFQEALRPGHAQVGTEIDTSPYGLRVPTFYSGSGEVFLITPPGFLQLSMAMYFGGLHCAAWNFDFPTRELCQLWRVSAITLTSIPLYYLINIWGMQAYYKHIAIRKELSTSFGRKRLPSSARRIYSGILVIMRTAAYVMFSWVLHQLLIFLYLIARITLIVLPFILLHGYPSRTLEDVEWTKYIPHVSWMFSQ